MNIFQKNYLTLNQAQPKLETDTNYSLKKKIEHLSFLYLVIFNEQFVSVSSFC